MSFKAFGIDFFEIELLRAGIRKLAKFENLTVEEAESASKSFRREGFLCRVLTGDDGFPVSTIKREFPVVNPARMLVAVEESVLNTAVQLEILLFSKDRNERHQAEREIGALLGYPSCCIDAYIERNHRSRTEEILAPYMNTSGEINPLLNPTCFLFYTCSCNCEKAGSIAEIIQEILKLKYPEAYEWNRKRCRMPVLFWDAARLLLLEGEADSSGILYSNVHIPRYLADDSHPLLNDLREMQAGLSTGNRLSIRSDGVHVHQDDDELFVFDRESILYLPRIIDPEKRSSCFKNPEIVCVYLHDDGAVPETEGELNFLAGNLKDIGYTPHVVRYVPADHRIEATRIGNEIVGFDPGLVVFNREPHIKIKQILADKNVPAIVPEDFSCLKAIDQILIMENGDSYSNTFKGCRQDLYLKQGIKSLPDNRVSREAKANLIWNIDTEIFIYDDLSRVVIAEALINEALKQNPFTTRINVNLSTVELSLLLMKYNRNSFPLEFFHQMSVDQIVAEKTLLSELAEVLKQNESIMVFYKLNLHNFSSAELEIMDAPVHADTIIEAMDIIEMLIEDHPECFRFDKTGNHSFRLFTPATTLDNLLHNFRVIVSRKLYERIPGIFRSGIASEIDDPETKHFIRLFKSLSDEFSGIKEAKIFGQVLMRMNACMDSSYKTDRAVLRRILKETTQNSSIMRDTPDLLTIRDILIEKYPAGDLVGSMHVLKYELVDNDSRLRMVLSDDGSEKTCQVDFTESVPSVSPFEIGNIKVFMNIYNSDDITEESRQLFNEISEAIKNSASE